MGWVDNVVTFLPTCLRFPASRSSSGPNLDISYHITAYSAGLDHALDREAPTL